MPENPTSESEREFNPELHQEALNSLDSFDVNSISREFSNIQETIDPYNPGIREDMETNTDVDFDQGAFWDFTSGFWNSFIVGAAEGVANLAPTISNAVHETEFANDWIDNVSDFAEQFETIYSDDYYKPIENFEDINSSHFWAGLGNGIGFVAGIGKFAKAGQLLSKGGRALNRGQKLLEGTSDAFKSGAKFRNSIDDIVKSIFSKSKTAKTIKKVPVFKAGAKGKVSPKVYESMKSNLDKIGKLGEKSIRNGGRMGSFLGGTSMMYGMVQEEALEAGLDRTSAARFALGVAGVVSLTEGAALEWIGKIPAKAIQKQVVKTAVRNNLKGKGKLPAEKLMKSFLPSYTKALKGVDLFEGAAVEFGQEFSQTYIEEGAKQMYDNVFADKDATAGKGKFDKEVFDLEADSIQGFFTDGKDSKKTFTNSVFAGILGGIIGGGMAGMNLRSQHGERNLGNESLFNLISDDIINDKTENIDKIQEELKKARGRERISDKDIQDTNDIINEMTEFVKEQGVGGKSVSDPVAQYQLFNLNRAAKSVASKIITDEKIREESGDILDVQVEENVKENQKKTKLLQLLQLNIGVNYQEIMLTQTAETLDATEFSDKMLTYEAIATKIVGGAIETEEDLNSEIDKVFDSIAKKELEKIKKEAKKSEEATKQETEETEETPTTKTTETSTEQTEATEETEATESTEETEEEVYTADGYKNKIEGYTQEEIEKEKDILNDKENKDLNKEQKLKTIEIVEFNKSLNNEDPNEQIRIQREKAEKAEKDKVAKEEAEKEKAKKQEFKNATTYTTKGSFQKAEKDKKLSDQDIIQTYNEAVKNTSSRNKNNRSAVAIKSYIEKKYPDIINQKPNQDGKEKSQKTKSKETKGKETVVLEDTEEVVSGKEQSPTDTTTEVKSMESELLELKTNASEYTVKGYDDAKKAIRKKYKDVDSNPDGDTTNSNNLGLSEEEKQLNNEQNKQNKNTENIDEKIIAKGLNLNISKKQRKGIASKIAESQLIADNPVLYNKIKEHFKKMFPMIPVSTVERLFDKYGNEVLGKVSEKGITISDQGFQSTVIHEFAHVYLDIIADKEIVNLALNWIKGTQYYTDAKKAYPNDTVRDQQMEALVQALSENAVPKLEQKLSDNQITKWLSIAKKLWRTIKRMFTGYNESNYIDYLADSLIFNSKPIMVDTSYLSGVDKYQKKAIDQTDILFNNNVLLRTIKQFSISSLVNKGNVFQAETVLANLKLMFSNHLSENNDAITNKLNYQYNQLKTQNKEFKGKNFNDLSSLEQTEILFENTIYDDGVTYQEHTKNVVEYLTKLPTEQVSNIDINKEIKDNEKSQEEKGKNQKEAIKGSKKMQTSVNALLARLTDDQGQMINHDDAYAYITNVAERSSTTEELLRFVQEDADKGVNPSAIALNNTFAAISDYDADETTKILQNVLTQALSNQSVAQKSIIVGENEKGEKTAQIFAVSKSKKRRARTLTIKGSLISDNFLNLKLFGEKYKKQTIKDVFKKLLNKKGDTPKFGFFYGSSKVSNYALLSQFEVDDVNALGNMLFQVDGQFEVEDYINWLSTPENLNKKNDKGNLTGRAKLLKEIANQTDEQKRKKLAGQFFMAEVLNIATEQLSKDENSKYFEKFGNNGRMNNLINFASQVYDSGIDNANMFINSSGNTVSTIRYGSALNRTLADISRAGKFAKEKQESKIKTKSGEYVYLFKNNPVFKQLYDTGIFNWAIDDAVNFKDRSIKEHNKQSGIDLFISQFLFFSNDQNRQKYYQKLMINDRSHSNFVEVKRLTNDEIKNSLNQQRQVDTYYLNEGYKKIDKAKYDSKLTKEQVLEEKAKRKKQYLEEWNKLSYNFAYDINGEVVVKNFDPMYLDNTEKELKNIKDEIVRKGIREKVNQVNKEIRNLDSVLEKVALKDTVKKDHVGEKNKLYKTYAELLQSYVLNERVNRLALNDLVSAPVALRLVKKGKIDKSNILKRNSGFDSTGLRVDLSDKPTMTVVYQKNDKDGNPISDSFLWRSKGMTAAIQEQLGDPVLDKISHNSKDGEYMIDDKGNNIYHKNSSVNYVGDENDNNIVEMAKAMKGENYEESDFYRVSKMLEILEKKYGETHYIQIIDQDAIKGTKDDIVPMTVEDLFNALSKDNFDSINKSKYEYTSQNFYIPFNENKEGKKLNTQFAKLSTQAVKIWTGNTNQDDALLESEKLEQQIVDYLLEQMGINESENDYLKSKEFQKLFNTETILKELLKKVDDLQDPDTSQLLKDIIDYNKKQGKILDKARKKVSKLESKENLTESEKEQLAIAKDELENKKTINKIDHPAMTPQLKQVILSAVQAKGLDVRVPGAYLKMVPDMDNQLGPNEIILPWSMFGDTREQAEKFLKEQDEKGGVFVPGVRVPASDAISTLNARVVGLINGDGNIAILPHYFTIKSDADHDGDKVFIYKQDLKTENGKTVVKEDSKANEIYKSINRLSQSDNYNQRIEDGSIDLSSLEDLVNDIETELKKENNGVGLPSKFDFASSSEMSATDARMSFGEIAVGILAVAGKLNSALYQSNTRFKTKKPITIDGKTYDLIGVGVNEYDKTSNDIAMLLQGALDMTGNPILLRSGIDGSNINVVVSMLISGIPLKTVIKFINKTEIKEHYKTDQFKNNAFTEKANKNKFKETLAQKIKDEDGKSGSRTNVKENLETLQYFTEFSQELNAITSIIQLDGSLPNDGYMLKDLQNTFSLIKSEKSKTKLDYKNFSDRPFTKHYEKLVDAAVGLMSHHFITENESYYDEINKIEETRSYSDVREFDPSKEKRRVDDLFSLMVSQNLLDESQLADIKENGVGSVLQSLKENVLESVESSYKQITKNNTVSDYIAEVIALEGLKGNKITARRNNYANLFSKLEEAITIDNDETNVGAYIESILIKNQNNINETVKSLQEEGVSVANRSFTLKEIVDVINNFSQYKEIKNDELIESNILANNKFLQLLQVKIQTDKITKETINVLSGKEDVRYLTTTQKQIAKRDFKKLPYEVQNRFLAYQLLKFGLSSKLGSIISIMPNEFTLDYLKEISNIKSIGEKEKKIYKLKDFRLAQSYNDLNYPVKQYKKTTKLEEQGKNTFAYNVNQYGASNIIKGKDGVRFKIDGDETLYQFKEIKGSENSEVVEVKSFAAERKEDYTLFNNAETVNIEEGIERKNKCS